MARANTLIFFAPGEMLEAGHGEDVPRFLLPREQGHPPVRQHPDCSVLVSSQDGRMTLFSWDKKPGHVVAVSGLEHFAWGEEH